MEKNKLVVCTYLDRHVYSCIQKVAEALGVSVCEYIRRLILNDLEKRSAFLESLAEFKKPAG